MLWLLFPTSDSLIVIWSHLYEQNRGSVQDQGCAAISYWTFHTHEPKQDFSAFLPQRFPLWQAENQTVSNWIHTGSTISSPLRQCCNNSPSGTRHKVAVTSGMLFRGWKIDVNGCWSVYKVKERPNKYIWNFFIPRLLNVCINLLRLDDESPWSKGYRSIGTVPYHVGQHWSNTYRGCITSKP